jgi:hypothetical protein
MGNLADKADQLEKAIQEMAFDGIQERRDYDQSVKLLEIAEDVWHISERLGAIEGPSS